MRLAVRGVITVDGSPLDMVVKFSKGDAARQIAFREAEAQAVAQFWARKWNALDPPLRLEVVPAYVLELVDRPGRPVCGCERFIEGSFRKYNNNVGAAVATGPADEDDLSTAAQAFSHFTYEKSNHELLVCDIQGVGHVLTDPQVHTSSGKGFGEGNLGLTGMRAFLLRHTCNPTCRALALASVEPSAIPTVAPVPTTAAAAAKRQQYAPSRQVERTEAADVRRRDASTVGSALSVRPRAARGIACGCSRGVACLSLYESPLSLTFACMRLVSAVGDRRIRRRVR